MNEVIICRPLCGMVYVGWEEVERQEFKVWGNPEDITYSRVIHLLFYSFSSSTDTTSESLVKKKPVRKRSRISDSDSDGDEATTPPVAVPSELPAKVAKPNSTPPTSSSSSREPSGVKAADLLKTPPKRITARKHTGVVKRSPPSGVSGSGKESSVTSPPSAEEKMDSASREDAVVKNTEEAVEQDSKLKVKEDKEVVTNSSSTGKVYFMNYVFIYICRYVLYVSMSVCTYVEDVCMCVDNIYLCSLCQFVHSSC